MRYQTNHSEMALTLNTKHQYLKYFEDKSSFEHIAAFAPTQNWEKFSGYDVHVPFLKTAVYQYKRPKILESKSVSEGDRQFKLDRNQWLTLLLLFEPGEAFFALPTVWSNDELPEAVERTLFIDVYGILPDTTRVYIPSGCVSDGTINGFLKAKTASHSKYLLHPRYLYGWERHRDELTDCTLGLVIRDADELYSIEQYRQDEEDTYEYPTTLAFDRFRERIHRLSAHNYSAKDRRQWAFKRLWSILYRQTSIYRELYRLIAIVENIFKGINDRASAWFMSQGIIDYQFKWILTEFSDFTLPDKTVSDNTTNRSKNIEYIYNTFDFQAAYNRLEKVLSDFEDKNVDPRRFRIGRVRNTVLGK